MPPSWDNESFTSQWNMLNEQVVYTNGKVCDKPGKVRDKAPKVCDKAPKVHDRTEPGPKIA